MNNFDHKWQKLAGLARQAPTAADEAAPFGFSTRVAALAMQGASIGNAWSLLEKFALRGLIAAGVLSVATAAYSFTSALTDHEDESVLTDPVAELLDIS